jgi:hypothetical protein
MSLFSRAIKDQEESSHLTKTTFLNLVKETEFRELLTKLYNSDSTQLKLTATILNAIYTEGKTTFFLSKRSLLALIKSDKKNLQYKQRTGIKLGKKAGIYVGYLLKEWLKSSSTYSEWDIIRVCKPNEFNPTTIELVGKDVLDAMDSRGQLRVNQQSIIRQSVVNLGSMLGQCPTSSNDNTELEDNDTPSNPINPSNPTNSTPQGVAASCEKGMKEKMYFQDMNVSLFTSDPDVCDFGLDI